MPQPQTRDDRRHAEQPQAPSGRAVLQQLTRIADSRQGTGGEVGAVGDQAESGKKTQHERARHAQGGRGAPGQQRYDGAQHRPCPSDCGRPGVLRQVRAGDRQRMQDHPGYAATRQLGAHDVAELVHRLHSQPRAEQGRNDQDGVKNAGPVRFAEHAWASKTVVRFLEIGC